ncbi:3-oxoacyl-[acyl-carrier protein] reductase [Fimbriiglobus ruber]|uniref:3-oxoacyl-[acyl-carrier protein] reductase n=1 Tax=Fimbriiglobus ruber TaxID=1908690 RepID=A0A225E2M9_9BACT|nr:3-oxoacyl-[acyl-carrier protein] reductase [Fimbriiglobus ruber]
MDRVSSSSIDLRTRAGGGFCAVVRSDRPTDTLPRIEAEDRSRQVFHFLNRVWSVERFLFSDSPEVTQVGLEQPGLDSGG